MIDSKKIEFKIKESVYLGLNTIYCRVDNKEDLNAVFSWGIAPTFERFEKTHNRHVFKFYLTEPAIRFFKDIVKNYPKDWLIKEGI